MKKGRGGGGRVYLAGARSDPGFYIAPDFGGGRMRTAHVLPPNSALLGNPFVPHQFSLPPSSTATSPPVWFCSSSPPTHPQPRLVRRRYRLRHFGGAKDGNFNIGHEVSIYVLFFRRLYVFFLRGTCTHVGGGKGTCQHRSSAVRNVGGIDMYFTYSST